MRNLAGVVPVLGVLVLAVATASPQSSSMSPDQRSSLVIVFKDGHQQSFPVADVARIEFKTPAVSAPIAGRGKFLGKWRVGEGNGAHFFITLEPDGEAKKSIGASHGTWAVVEGEARISWDDGWHDILRKVGHKYEKVAFAPGKSFSDQPDNVTDAANTEPSPI